jgi:RNA polymerase sigma-B factor
VRAGQAAVGLVERMSARAEVYAEAVERRTRRAEERVLFLRLTREHSTRARDDLVERFMPLARQLARRYRTSADVEDLEQVAAIGLLKAIDRFDPDRGLAFSSFAFPTIVGELKRYLRDLGWSVRVPRDLQELYVRLDRQTAALSAELGRAPTVAEVAARVDCTVERVLEARQAVTARHPLSLDAPRSSADEPDGLGLDVPAEEPGFVAAERSAALGDLLTALPARDRRVLRLRFQEDLTQTEIGRRLGISQMQVSRVIHRALATLERAAADQ